MSWFKWETIILGSFGKSLQSRRNNLKTDGYTTGMNPHNEKCIWVALKIQTSSTEKICETLISVKSCESETNVSYPIHEINLKK